VARVSTLTIASKPFAVLTRPHNRYALVRRFMRGVRCSMRFFTLVYGKILRDTLSRDSREDVAVFSARIQMSLLLFFTILDAWILCALPLGIFETVNLHIAAIICLILVYVAVLSLTKNFDLIEFEELRRSSSKTRLIASAFPYAVFVSFALAIWYSIALFPTGT
jgi:hypothetical protein